MISRGRATAIAAIAGRSQIAPTNEVWTGLRVARPLRGGCSWRQFVRTHVFHHLLRSLFHLLLVRGASKSDETSPQIRLRLIGASGRAGFGPRRPAR
jgi:hypothetical protein